MKLLGGEGLQHTLFSAKWRRNGWMYAFYFFTVYVIYFILTFWILKVSMVGITWLIMLILVIILSILAIIITIINVIKRFHDVGKNWWNTLFLLIPLYNIIVGLKLYFQLWDKWDNKYWKQPEKVSKTTKIITIIIFAAWVIEYLFINIIMQPKI